MNVFTQFETTLVGYNYTIIELVEHQGLSMGFTYLVNMSLIAIDCNLFQFKKVR